MSGVSRHPASLLALIAGVAVVGLGVSGCAGDDAPSDTNHHVYVTVRDAASIIKGQDVRAAGKRVGKIAGVEPTDRGRGVRLELAVNDGVWPLPRGSKVTLRWGGTVSFLNRYVDLRMGPPTAPTLAEGATLPASATRTPTELDSVFATFDRPTRRSLKAFLDNAGSTFALSRQPLRRALGRAPAALQNASAAIGDLSASERSLDTLVGSAGHVVEALHRADPRLQQLISDTGATLGATAAHSAALQDTVNELPSTLTQTQAIAARARSTLDAGDRLLAKLSPGVTQLRRLPAPLNDLLASLVSVGPAATATLRTAADDTPSITRLVTKATALLPTVDGVARQATQALNCIRPYSPEIAAFFSNWGDFISQVDGKDHLIRANIQSLLPAAAPVMPYDSSAAVKLFPGLRYAFPRPPGYDADQPWFLPECHAGQDALDPSKDPESRTAKP
jgi:phospholipid/cholesterol/gamma-HCH transport system substrate-binding protein